MFWLEPAPSDDEEENIDACRIAAAEYDWVAQQTIWPSAAASEKVEKRSRTCQGLTG